MIKCQGVNRPPGSKGEQLTSLPIDHWKAKINTIIKYIEKRWSPPPTLRSYDLVMLTLDKLKKLPNISVFDLLSTPFPMWNLKFLHREVKYQISAIHGRDNTTSIAI